VVRHRIVGIWGAEAMGFKNYVDGHLAGTGCRERKTGFSDSKLPELFSLFNPAVVLSQANKIKVFISVEDAVQNEKLAGLARQQGSNASESLTELNVVKKQSASTRPDKSLTRKHQCRPQRTVFLLRTSAECVVVGLTDMLRQGSDISAFYPM